MHLDLVVAVDQSDFYGRFGEVSLTLLGLWFVVVQLRFHDWARQPHLRRQATAVSLILGLPGGLSLVSLIDPDTPGIWRTAFVVGGTLGCLGVLAVLVGPGANQRGQQLSPVALGLGTSAALFAAVTLVAVWSAAGGSRGLGLEPVEAEAVLFSLLLLVGVVVAWLMLFADQPVPGEREPGQPSAGEGSGSP